MERINRVKFFSYVKRHLDESLVSFWTSPCVSCVCMCFDRELVLLNAVHNTSDIQLLAAVKIQIIYID